MTDTQFIQLRSITQDMLTLAREMEDQGLVDQSQQLAKLVGKLGGSIMRIHWESEIDE